MDESYEITGICLVCKLKSNKVYEFEYDEKWDFCKEKLELCKKCYDCLIGKLICDNVNLWKLHKKYKMKSLKEIYQERINKCPTCFVENQACESCMRQYNFMLDWWD